MTRHIFFDDSGRVVQSNTGGHPETVAMATGLSYIESDEPIWGPCWVQDGVLHQAPPPPGPRHDWDWATRSWLENLSAARASKSQAIEAAREAAMAAPIPHRGAMLDADAEAHRNISSKLLELQQRQLLGMPVDPDTLFWNDADNRTHVFSSASELAQWLGELAIAISDRGTRCYAWSGGQKALLRSAQDQTAIEAVSTTFP